MNRRTFLKSVGFGAAALVIPQSSRAIQRLARKTTADHPNIVFIMADDMGIGDTTVYNPESKIPTPHMERLAAQSVIFTDAHSPSAVCTPTRYGLLTGRYCWRSRLKRRVFGGFNRPLIEPDRLTVPSLLKQHGYATACIGKWHLGMDWTLQEGFDQYRQSGSTIDFTEPILSGPTELGFDYFFGTSANPTDDPPELFIENHQIVYMEPRWEHEEVDTTFTEKSIEFIEQHAAGSPDEPFFLYFAIAAPHIPWLPPAFVQGASDAGDRGDQVVLVDWMLGEIMDTLDRLNLSENTLLIFTSDNGPREGVNGHKSAGDWRGLKGEIWEGGHRVPFIARWPGRIAPGTISDELTTLTDLMATCAAVVGAQLPIDSGPDSFSILPALLGHDLEEPIREAAVHHSGEGVFAIRQDEWKLIVGTKGGGYHDGGPNPDTPGQLYNMVDDPDETTDLWEVHPEIVERLENLLEQYKEQGFSTALDPPVAAFSSELTSGCAGLQVAFIDESTGAPVLWLWSFGDGATSTGQHPTHTYDEEGVYTVSLTVTNVRGEDTEMKEGYISVGPSPPTAGFSAEPSSGRAPAQIAFADESTSSPTSWLWSFGDGETSTQQHPTHTYDEKGAYTVSLTVANACGEDTETKDGYIRIRHGADVDMNARVNAQDMQRVVNAALGVDSGYDCDISGDGRVNALDVQHVINAVLGLW